MNSPFGAVVALADLGELGPSIVENAGGESVGILPLLAYRGLLAKLYNRERLRRPDLPQLDRMIALPDALAPADRSRIIRSTSWPVARIVDRGDTVGVVIREAPDRLRTEVCSLVGTAIRRQFVTLDLLAQPDEYLQRRCISVQSVAARLSVCRRIASIAAILERNGVVYADWSYANAFWGPTDQSVFLIDTDTCSFGRRSHVRTPNFDDPLTPMGADVDNATDRYRLALLVGRCVTGRREPKALLSALLTPPSEDYAAAYDTIRAVLMAEDRTARHSIAVLWHALEAAEQGKQYTPPPVKAARGPSNVVTWKPRRGLHGNPDGSWLTGADAPEPDGTTQVGPASSFTSAPSHPWFPFRTAKPAQPPWRKLWRHALGN